MINLLETVVLNPRAFAHLVSKLYTRILLADQKWIQVHLSFFTNSFLCAVPQCIFAYIYLFEFERKQTFRGRNYNSCDSVSARGNLLLVFVPILKHFFDLEQMRWLICGINYSFVYSNSGKLRT